MLKYIFITEERKILSEEVQYKHCHFCEQNVGHTSDYLKCVCGYAYCRHYLCNYSRHQYHCQTLHETLEVSKKPTFCKFTFNSFLQQSILFCFRYMIFLA